MEDKYKEALERAKSYYPDNLFLDTIFPELAESEEDERIRKELIDYLWGQKIYYESDEVKMGDSQKCRLMIDGIAWLEKQKAKERLDRMAPIYNDKESFESALEKAWKYYNESASRTVDSFEDDYIECVFSKGFREGFLYKEKQKEEEGYEAIPVESTLEYKIGKHAGFLEGLEVGRKQKEQKPDSFGDTLSDRIPDNWRMNLSTCNPSDSHLKAENMDTIEACMLRYLQSAANRKNDCEVIEDTWEYKKQLVDLIQKPEWSEKDEIVYESIQTILLAEARFVEERKWFDSIKARIKSTCWDEKDEKMCDRLIDRLQFITLNTRTDSTSSNVTFFDEIDWLKSLRPQPKQEWSKEDKEMLKSIIEDVTPVGECPDYPTDEEREYYYSGQDKTNWLKDLPNRFNLQSNQGWSEEDKAMIERLIRHTQKEFDELCNDRYGHQEIISDLKESCRERMNWLENRLKSLRPQPQEQKPVKKEITLTDFEEILNTFLFDFANSPIEGCEPKEFITKYSTEILKAAYKELNAQLQQDIFEAKQEGRREGYEAARAEEKENLIMANSPQLKEQKPEWSEEDVRHLYNIIFAVNNTYKNNKEQKVQLISWLKSLRPSWKPSEEQLSALLAVFNDPNNIGSQTCQLALTDLYEQLKKLM